MSFSTMQPEALATAQLTAHAHMHRAIREAVRGRRNDHRGVGRIEGVLR